MLVLLSDGLICVGTSQQVSQGSLCSESSPPDPPPRTPSRPVSAVITGSVINSGSVGALSSVRVSGPSSEAGSPRTAGMSSMLYIGQC